MNNQQQRAELLDVIGELCLRYPNWRFGQMIENIAGWADQSAWDVEDEELLQAVRFHLEELACRDTREKADASTGQ